MDAKNFRIAVERQVWQRQEVRIKLPPHFPRYLVRQGIIKSTKLISDHYSFSNDDVESAVAFLMEPRLTKFKFKKRRKSNGTQRH